MNGLADIAQTTTYSAATGQACTSTVTPCTATNGGATGTATVTTIDAYDGFLKKSEETKLSSPALSDHIVNWTYDNALRVATRNIDAVTYTKTTFGYDSDSLLTSVAVNNGGSTMTLYRGSTNGIVKCISVGSVCTIFTYNAFGEVTEEKTTPTSCTSSCTPSGTPILDLIYRRTTDPSGRITQRAETSSLVAGTCTWSFAYNGADYTTSTTKYPERLSTASRSGGTNCGASSLTQTYDADGNIKTGLTRLERSTCRTG